MHHLLNDIGIAVLAATVLGLIAHWLRQPIILGYLIAGALIGPQMGFGLIHDAESIEIISEIGLILLLFIIGLELDVKALLAAGQAAARRGLRAVPAVRRDGRRPVRRARLRPDGRAAATACTSP